MSKPLVIAIDGPVAVGKSTVGSLLARRLGYSFVDTGIIYRAMAWLALERGADPDDEAGLAELARNSDLDFLPGPNGETCRVFVGGRDVTSQMRQPRVEGVVSQVSRVPEVRETLLERQRELARRGKVVMAGRDIGTVVLPQADLKVFLVASPRERARRRHEELVQMGEPATFSEVLADLERRDRIDQERSVAPLRQAADAHVVDTEGLTADQVVDRILKLAGVPWGSSTG